MPARGHNLIARAPPAEHCKVELRGTITTVSHGVDDSVEGEGTTANKPWQTPTDAR